MTPKLAQAVDPIYLHVLGLLDRIAENENPAPRDERIRIRALLDQAEAMIGSGQEWELAKYALVSWIDEMLVDAPWEGGEWWNNNVLEVELFNTRLCNEQFFVRAQEASTLDRRDALEVYYVCVVLGFRGLYHDPHMAAVTAPSLQLPVELDTWAKQTAASIRLGQGRPQLSPPGREVLGAPPLRPKSRMVWAWFAACVLATVATIYFVHFRLLT